MTEYAPYLWHDNVIHGLRLILADPDRGDWRSELVIDIDHIIGWSCAPDGTGQFQVAPATLTFQDVGDLCVSIDCGDTGGRVALHELSIDRIIREPVEDQQVCLDRPYYRWRIELNWPAGGLVRFAASGFTQVLHGDPVRSDRVGLPAAFRRLARERSSAAS